MFDKVNYSMIVLSVAYCNTPKSNVLVVDTTFSPGEIFCPIFTFPNLNIIRFCDTIRVRETRKWRFSLCFKTLFNEQHCFSAGSIVAGGEINRLSKSKSCNVLLCSNK